MSQPLIVIVGPTAVGKSHLAQELAERYGGAILSADAMQVYRGFDRATSKPTIEARTRVPHFLVDIADPRDDFSAGDFVRAAEEALAEVRRLGRTPILVGGTGFYVRAFLRGLFEAPRRNESLRRRLCDLAARRGSGHLHRLLLRLDPVTASKLDPGDEQRLVRALEIRLVSGRKMSDLVREDGGGLRHGPDRHLAVKLGLRLDRIELARRIEARVAAFFDAGVIDEVHDLLAAGVPETANAFRGIGYREALEVVRGHIDEDEARRRTTAATRRYAKRQMTWFRAEPGIRWLDAEPSPEEIFRVAAAQDR